MNTIINNIINNNLIMNIHHNTVIEIEISTIIKITIIIGNWVLFHQNYLHHQNIVIIIIIINQETIITINTNIINIIKDNHKDIIKTQINLQI
jgi:hypothetical protein